MAIVIAFTVVTVSAAFAAPQNGGNPSVTLDVSPGDGQNLTSPQSVTVTGVGFGSSLGGTIHQCRFDNATQFNVCSNQLAQFTSSAAGTFSESVNVSSTFTGLNAQGQPVQVSCVPTPTPPCTIEASTNTGQFFSAHTISFAGGGSTTTSTTSTSTTSTSTTSSTTSTTAPPATTSSTSSTTTPSTIPTTSTTTLSQCDKVRLGKAAFNAQIDSLVAAVNASNLSPAEKSAALARLAATRAQGNSQFDAQLANCPPAT